MYRRHPACTELAVETVPLGKRQSESFDQGSQGGGRQSGTDWSASAGLNVHAEARNRT